MGGRGGSSTIQSKESRQIDPTADVPYMSLEARKAELKDLKKEMNQTYTKKQLNDFRNDYIVALNTYSEADDLESVASTESNVEKKQRLLERSKNKTKKADNMMNKIPAKYQRMNALKNFTGEDW